MKDSSPVRIKMCGMTRKEDLAFACALGVDALGFIFYEASPRNLTLEQAQGLLKELPPFVDVVAVVVNPEKEFVEALLSQLPIQFLQFHGEESPEFCEQFQRPYIKAIAAQDLRQIEDSIKVYSRASALLLDTPSEYLRGGTGLHFDWRIVPKNSTKPLILSGGLNPENVLHAVQSCSPYAVDVNSGVERAFGVKDPTKMSQLVEVLWGGS